MTAAAVRIWHRVHRWTSLVCTLVLLLLCLTGLPLIFRDEIDDWLEPRRAAWAAPPGADAAPLDQLVTKVRQAHPNLVVNSFYWDKHAPGLVWFTLQPRPRAPVSEFRWVAIDPRTAQLVEQPPRPPPVTRFILKLHKE